VPRNLFTAPIAELTFSDVVAFCNEGIRESVNLDYKRELSSMERLAKTICAFANSLGGIVIVGVDEDDDSRPKPPFSGIPFAPKLGERIWNALLDNIDPPVMPEVHVCPPEDDRTFILVRVAPSNTTPHAVRHGRHAYLRVGNITKVDDAEQLATMGELEWLRNRRRKAEEFAETLAVRAVERLESVLVIRGKLPNTPRVEILTVPRFPVDPLVAAPELAEMRRELRLHADRASERWLAHE